jgi:hypothetical protein
MVVLAGHSSTSLVMSIPKPSLEFLSTSWFAMAEVRRRNDARMARKLREAAMLREERGRCSKVVAKVTIRYLNV